MYLQNNNLLGIILMTLGMFCLSVNDVTVKSLNEQFPVWEIVFFRALSGFFISIGLISFFGINKIKTKKPFLHFVRAFSAVCCVVFYFFGLKYLFLSENVTIVHSAPILAAIIAVPVLGEKLGLKRTLAIILGFVGVLIIVKPGTDFFKIVAIFPILSAVFMALVYISTRSLMRTESSVAIIFYYSLTLLITSLVFFPTDFLMPSFPQLILLLNLGIMGSLGHFFISQAAKYADVVVISPFEYTSFLFVSVMGYYFFNEIPTNSIYLGGFLIIVSGLYIAYREHHLGKQTR